MSSILEQSLLGKQVSYTHLHSPDLLFPVPRQIKRDEIAVEPPLPFYGSDVWNAFELSWLNSKGKPVVAMGEFIFPCETPNLIESKSLKLYLNSLSNSVFDSLNEVAAIIAKDLTHASGMPVQVNIQLLHEVKMDCMMEFDGVCLDDIDVACDVYDINPNFLRVNPGEVSETLYTHLLKSNCLVTGQPDWASVQIIYSGKPIDHKGLLQYLVSYRNHNGFHEQCVERIFIDIWRCCQPSELTVYARYTRRGGLDINPYRSTNSKILLKNQRLIRQ